CQTPHRHSFYTAGDRDLGVGKTSIIKRYVHQIFSQHYRATIGVDFALKVIQWDNNTVVRLQLWDIAGQERYGNMTRVYYREAVGAMVVFDVTRASTFEAVLKWKDDLDSKVTLNHGRPVPVVLLANKSDQLPSHSPKLDTFCRENGFVAWFETSAKVRPVTRRAALKGLDASWSFLYSLLPPLVLHVTAVSILSSCMTAIRSELTTFE
uniref:Ras-related protein Rab n=1 Tax=Neogobius melanostomus TaxID=47308 RepID=A0A8C6WQ88_9GOBI